MEPARDAIGPRILVGGGSLDRFGEEAGGLGARALILSPATPEPRQSELLARLGGLLRRARVGHHPFPRVPRAGARLENCIASAAEAARESHCRLIVGIGDAEALDAARGAAAAALLPSLLVPTAVGYGAVGASASLPFPDVLLLDPAAACGSPPRRTAALGVRLLAGLLERHAAVASASSPPEDASSEALEDAMRGIIDHLPTAVAAPDDPGPRDALAVATARAAEGMAAAGPGARPSLAMAAKLAGPGLEPDAALAALLASLLERGVAAGLQPARIARFGRQVLGIREADDGRAAVWAAGGLRQWIRNLGFPAGLPLPGTGARQAGGKNVKKVDSLQEEP